ncbi:hypothetical protein StoSoilA2_24260 [Arthrobacter sp. StoSoilA2]|nr:hypothetical protein StoSoilA2_24260 [Arthrobacter sp. StoSoilA2]
MFEAYCLPSVQAQTNQNFHWIVYFDPASPQWLLDRINELNKRKTFDVRLRAEISTEELIGDIEQVVGNRSHILLTTNLDNDDGLGLNFVDRLQRVAGGETTTAIYLSSGLVKGKGSVYLRRDRRNAFCSVRACWESPVTCWSAWHNRLGEAMEVTEVRGSPAWLQVIHGSNVSNRIRGRLVSPESFYSEFPDLLWDVPLPKRWEVIRDLALAWPARAIREALRAGAKAATVAFFGPQGIDKVKIILTSRRRDMAPSRLD